MKSHTTALEVSSPPMRGPPVCVHGLTLPAPTQNPGAESFYSLNPSNVSCKEWKKQSPDTGEYNPMC